ncbi:molybdopterin-dependent oxidoreductase [Tunturiibacter gelidiferens]|uniref:molybdopterin-dependent oxidoreductase n=2 Tax=Tunturiibacter gelidiferens TaxID=3069689 RepID=UPI003D9AE2B0
MQLGCQPMSPSIPPHLEPNSTNTLLVQPGVLVVKRHHILVRCSHWLNVLLLLGLILSGISIYWASPIYQHKPEPVTGNFDVAADIGIWMCRHVPGLHHYASPPDWIYNHVSLGPGMLAPALRLHWLCAYLFMLNGMVYVAGLVMGGGWRSLVPRRTDLVDALRMLRYYLGVPFAKLTRRQWPHPEFSTKYNPLQRAAYFSVPVAGFLSVATGWAIHKPMQLHWLAALFGGFDAARVWHFWLMWLFIFFVVPHVILVFADRWDTLRSMIVGWSTRVDRSGTIKMNNEEKGNSAEPKDLPSTGKGSEQDVAELPAADPEDTNPSVPTAIETQTTVKATSPQVDTDETPSLSANQVPQTDPVAVPAAAEPVDVKEHQSLFGERPLPIVEMAPRILRYRTRRDVLLFGAGAMAAAASARFFLPPATLSHPGVRGDMSIAGKEWLLNKAIRVDDDVAETLYSANRMVPIYTKSQITPIKNNYNGATPDPAYIPGWRLTLDGLSSGLIVSLDIRALLVHHQIHDQITRLVCVEGWSAIAWWSGLRFDDLLHAYPPVSQAKWAHIESSVNLDTNGNPDPYFVSIDLLTAQHPQTLLATHLNGKPLTVEHGTPLRLLAPVKLGLKNIKAITRITYTKDEPPDYWAKRGYSRYDGI